MSFQIALMAGMAAMSVAQAASSASKGAAAAGRGIASAGKAEEAARTETYLNDLQAQVRGGGYQVAASQTDISSAEVGMRTAQQELMRRRELDRLLQGNAIDLVARGGVQTGQDSASAIDDYNRAMAEEDVGTMRMMGESAKRQLSFRKQNLEMAAKGAELQGLYGQATGQNKVDALERQKADLGARAQDIGSDAVFKIGSTLMNFAGSNFGGSKTPSTDETMRTAIPKDKWSDYGVS
jgi:hypothetical protein